MDDFMRAFFGAQFGGPGAQQRSHRQHFSFQQQRRSQQHQNTRSRGENDEEDMDFDLRSVRWAPLLQMLLMLLVFLLPTVLSAFSMGAAARPMYSLKQTNDYPIEMQTLSGSILHKTRLHSRLAGKSRPRVARGIFYILLQY